MPTSRAPGASGRGDQPGCALGCLQQLTQVSVGWREAGTVPGRGKSCSRLSAPLALPENFLAALGIADIPKLLWHLKGRMVQKGWRFICRIYLLCSGSDAQTGEYVSSAPSTTKSVPCSAWDASGSSAQLDFFPRSFSTQLGSNSAPVSALQPQMCVFIICMCKSQKENLVFQVFGKAKYLFCIVRIIFCPPVRL